MESDASIELSPKGGPDHKSRLRRRIWTSSPLVGVFFATSFLLLLYLLLNQAQRWRVHGIPFNITITDEPAGYMQTLEGRLEIVDRMVFVRGMELPNYAIADIGDVRIALERHTRLEVLVNRSSSSVRVVIDSNRPRELPGGPALPMNTWLGLGDGGLAFNSIRHNGVSECRLNNIPFSLQNSQVHIAGKEIPIGQGRKIVFLRTDGSLSKIVNLD